MIFSILILLIAFFSLVVLMILHEFGHFFIAKYFRVRIDEFGIGYPPRIFGKKIGETIYSINWVPLGAFVRIHGEEGGVDDYRSFSNLKIWQRFLVVLGGVLAFWIASVVIFSLVFFMGVSLPIGDEDADGFANPQINIISVFPDSPAQKAGIKAKDIIKGIKTNNNIFYIDKIADFQKITNENKGKEITLLVERNGKKLEINLIPRITPPSGQGIVGVSLERMATLVQKYSWYEAPIQGAIYTGKVTMLSLKGIYIILSNLIIARELPKSAEFAGPLGITVFLANAATYGIGFFLYFIGTVSVLVAIFNLFPIPALDGGKLVFLLIEKLKGKPVSVKVEQRITAACFMLLIILSLFVTIKFDIPRFTDFIKSII